MVSRIMIKVFHDFKKCQDFVNKFSKKNHVDKIDISPIVVGQSEIRCFVILEYQDN